VVLTDKDMKMQSMKRWS